MFDQASHAIKFSDSPKSLWDKFDYWFCDTWLYKDVYRYSWLYRLRWYITHWWRNDHWVKTDLPIGYHDKPELMVHALFGMVDDFMSREGEDAPSRIVIEDNWFEIIVDILHFVHIEQPELQKQQEQIMDYLYTDYEMVFEECADRPGFSTMKFKYVGDPDSEFSEEYREELRKKLVDLEREEYEGIQEHLKKCIDIRGYLWT